MKQERKELLLKDLCGRLPYKVKALFPDLQGGYTSAVEEIDLDGYVKDFEGCQNEICDIKPYLFPLSSMTEEQEKEWIILYNETSGDNFCNQNATKLFDWYNKNHFDYRGLIGKGLAIDATGLRIYD